MGGMRYVGEVVYLPSLVVARTPPVLVAHEFVQCRLLGPAMVVLLDGWTLDTCQFVGDLDAMLVEVPQGRVVQGVIGLDHVTLRQCVIEAVGFIGPQRTLDRLRVGLMGLHA